MLKRGSNILNQHDHKLALSFGALVLVLMLTASGAASYLFSQLEQEQEDRLSGVIGVILGESISRVSFSSKYQARLFVEEMKSRVPELAFISVETKEGRILAHSDPTKNDGSMLDPADVDLRIQSLKTGSFVEGEQIRDGKTIKEVVLPFRGGLDAEVIGVVHTGINFDEVRKEQRANLFKLLILVAALTAAAIWIVLILSHHFGREVRALATHLQGILNHAPVAIDICDRTGRILAFSEAFELLFGPPAVNQTSTQLFAERLSDTIVKRLAETDRKVFESGVPCELELQVDIQGRSCTWNVSNFPIARDNGGKTTLACTFIHDISERKAAEEALRLLNRELDRRVLARTAQLETANREMHDFTYTVSHDLRAPLRHIDGFMDLLQQKAGQALDEESRHYMAAVSDAAQKMGLLIDDLLAFSRMGRHAMFFQAVDLGTLVCEVMRELEPDTAGRNIDWRIGELPTVSADAALLRMVLSNLITNALKYTRPRGQAEIEIGCQAGEKETIFFIRDNGVGFDMTYGDKLFGVFQRLHRAEEFEGTGIGLATVRRIIARHGGRTWAEGKIDQGASFYFSLPDSPRGGGDEKP